MSPSNSTWLLNVLALPWIYWTIGGAVAAFGVGLLYWSLLADRAGGRRRCPRCWYDMRGSTGLRCPECGHAPRSARGLLRTRRRWRLAALALFCCVGGTSIALIPKIQRDGWLSLVPTTVLLFAHPATPGWTDQHPVLIELDRRSAAANLAAWQWRQTRRRGIGSMAAATGVRRAISLGELDHRGAAVLSSRPLDKSRNVPRMEAP